jgi:hypothetical protein
MTHPGVGLLTALAFVLIVGDTGRFQRQAGGELDHGDAGDVEDTERGGAQ